MSKEDGRVEEDVGIASNETQGPVIRRSYKPFEFQVILEGSAKDWLTSKLLIVHPWVSTSGEANRLYIHDLLDKHIEDFLNDETPKE